MLATAADLPTDSHGWSTEFTWDGWRACTSVTGRDLRIWSRNGLPLLERFPELSALTEIAADRDMVLDGEIVAIDRAGQPSFSLLQQCTSPRPSAARTYSGGRR